MKKNIAVAVAVLFFVAALFFVFYPDSQENQALPFSDDSSVQNETTDIPFENSGSSADSGKETPAENVAEVNLPVSGLKASFDIVRVEEDGSMVAAGKGMAGAVVSLMDGESVLTEFTVNENGEWVYIPSEPLVAGTHEIWLRDDSMNARDESEVVVVDVPEPENAGDALAVMMSPDAEEVSVLQAPAPQVQIDIDIRSVNYINGAFIVQGTVRESGRINLYADNLFLGNVWAEAGEWSLRIPRKLEAGRKYLIRADKVDFKGKVTARVEVPFEIEKGIEEAKRRRIRVVKGDCLWKIAKHLYGSGFAYVTIYQANKNQIKNPDLIYPNQVFVLPPNPEK